MVSEPKTLQQAIVYFADADNCRQYLMIRRWPDGVVCPTCGSSKVSFLVKQQRWQCAGKHPKKQFSVKVGTIFEDSPLGLDKWLPAVWLLTNCKNGASSYEIHRALGVTQKTAWFMLHRIRLAMQNTKASKLSGEVEADETFVGGKVTNMHRTSRRKIQATNEGHWGKTVVLGLLERDGGVRAAVAPTRQSYEVQQHLNNNVEPGSTLYTDEFAVYQHVAPNQYTHQVINKLEAYVKGNVHVQGMENFWSLLKRSLKGTYVSVDPVHLQAYVDEQCFRFNNRKEMDDSERFSTALSQIVGKRITYAELIGKEGETAKEV